MFRNPVQWKHGSEDPESDTAFRYMFAVDTMAELETATLAVVDGEDFVPGYNQVYCEGASMRQMGLVEPFDRLAVFFKNLALGQTGASINSAHSRTCLFVARAPTPAARWPELPPTCASKSCCVT